MLWSMQGGRLYLQAPDHPNILRSRSSRKGGNQIENGVRSVWAGQWQNVTTARHNLEPTRITLSSPVTPHPRSQTPRPGLPAPTRARARTKLAGSHAQPRQEHTEALGFWQPLTQETKEKQSRMQPPPAKKVGKRPKPVPKPPGDLGDWFQRQQKNPEQMTRGRNPRLRGHEAAPMEQAQGKRRLMRPLACVNFHHFLERLRQWEEGVPVDCGKHWTQHKRVRNVSGSPSWASINSRTIKMAVNLSGVSP
jgi:hypothetical protein